MTVLFGGTVGFGFRGRSLVLPVGCGTVGFGFRCGAVSLGVRPHGIVLAGAVGLGFGRRALVFFLVLFLGGTCRVGLRGRSLVLFLGCTRRLGFGGRLVVLFLGVAFGL